MQGKKIYFVRHIEVDKNLSKKAWGQIDNTKITKKGESQLERINNYFRNQEADLILSSDLKRCKKTAEVISEATGSEIICSKSLRGLKFGKVKGLNMEELSKKFPEIIESWRLGLDPAMPNGESRTIMTTRVIYFINKYIKKKDIKKLIVVSHKGAISSALGHYLGIKPQKAYLIGCENASLSFVKYLDENRTKVEFINRKI